MCGPPYLDEDGEINNDESTSDYNNECSSCGADLSDCHCWDQYKD